MCSAQYVMCNSVNDVYVCKEICVLHNMLCSIWQMIYMYAMKLFDFIDIAFLRYNTSSIWRLRTLEKVVAESKTERA